MLEKEHPDRLVIVDDDPHVLHALRFAFEVDGYDVQTYKAGEEVLEALPVDAACIIIDEHLPGVSGVQTSSLLRARGVVVPMILITSHPSPAIRIRAKEHGVEIVEKPLVNGALALRVRELAGAPAVLAYD